MKYESILKDNDEPAGFEPNVATKALMLKARKKTYTYGNIDVPGLFNVNDHKYEIDSLIVGVIFIAEVLGIIALYFSSGATYFVPKLILAAVLLIADFVIAYLNRSKENEKCIAENRKRYALFYQKLPNNNRYLLEEENENKIINKIKNRSKIFLVLLLFVACLKTGIFFWDIKGGLTGWFLMQYGFLYATPLLFFTIAILHWEFFGHWYNTFLFDEAIEKDWKEHKKGIKAYKDDYAAWERKEKAKPNPNRIPNSRIGRPHTIKLNTLLQSVFNVNILDTVMSTSDVPHYIVVQTDNAAQLPDINGYIDGALEYKMNTLGVMTDDELLSLVGRQSDNEQGAIVGIEGIRHQLDSIVNTAPLNPSK